MKLNKMSKMEFVKLTQLTYDATTSANCAVRKTQNVQFELNLFISFKFSHI